RRVRVPARCRAGALYTRRPRVRAVSVVVLCLGARRDLRGAPVAARCRGVDLVLRPHGPAPAPDDGRSSAARARSTGDARAPLFFAPDAQAIAGRAEE